MSVSSQSSVEHFLLVVRDILSYLWRFARTSKCSGPIFQIGLRSAELSLQQGERDRLQRNAFKSSCSFLYDLHVRDNVSFC